MTGVEAFAFALLTRSKKGPLPIVLGFFFFFFFDYFLSFFILQGVVLGKGVDLGGARFFKKKKRNRLVLDELLIFINYIYLFFLAYLISITLYFISIASPSLY